MRLKVGVAAEAACKDFRQTAGSRLGGRGDLEALIIFIPFWLSM